MIVLRAASVREARWALGASGPVGRALARLTRPGAQQVFVPPGDDKDVAGRIERVTRSWLRSTRQHRNWAPRLLVATVDGPLGWAALEQLESVAAIVPAHVVAVTVGDAPGNDRDRPALAVTDPAAVEAIQALLGP